LGIGGKVMQEYELSFLYLPPKDWPLRAEDWHDQVDKIIAYTRQTIAQDIEAMKAYPIEVGSGGSENFVVQFVAAAIARGK